MDKKTTFELFSTNFLIMSHEFTLKFLNKYSAFIISFLIYNKNRVFLKIDKKINNRNLSIKNENSSFKNFYTNFINKYNSKLKTTNKIINISLDNNLLSTIFTIRNKEKFLNKYSVNVYTIKVNNYMSLVYILGFSHKLDKKTNTLITTNFNLLENVLKSLNSTIVENLPLIKILETLRFTSFFILNHKNEIITFYSPDKLFKDIKKGERIDDIFETIELNKKINNNKTITNCILYYKNNIYNDISMIDITLDLDNKLSPKLLILKNNFYIKKESLISEIFSILYNKHKSYNKKFEEILEKIRVFYNADYIFLSYPFNHKNLRNSDNSKSFYNLWEQFKNIKIQNMINKGKDLINDSSFMNINKMVSKSNKSVFVTEDNPIFKKDKGFKYLNIKSQITCEIKPKNDTSWLLGLCYIEKKIILRAYDKSLFDSMSQIIAHFLESMRYNKSINETIENYKNLFESIPLPTIVIDLNYNIIQTNKFFLKLVEKESKQIINKNMFDFFLLSYIRGELYYLDDENIKKFFLKKDFNSIAFFNFLKNPYIKSRKFFFRLKKTEKFYIFEIHKKKIINNNNIQYIIIFYDLTDRLKLSKKYAEIAKFESLGNITSTVAHEFNNLLTGIKGNLELIRMQVESLIKNKNLENANFENLKESISDILYLTDKGKELTTNLLGYSKKRPSQLETIEINKYLKNEIKILKNLIGERVKISFKPFDKSIYITIDKNGLSHVLMNLFINAKDAMEGIGSISISVKTIKITRKEYPKVDEKFLNKKMVVIKVEDIGTGIPDEYINKIFDPFFTTKEETKGTGLGLSFVKGFVEQHKGFIRVTSKPNVGTTFSLHFSINFKPADISENKNIKHIKDTNNENNINYLKNNIKQILIIEDEETILKFLKKSFNNIGIETIVANNFQDAKNKISLNYNNLDFIISDVILKQENGYNLYKRMKNLKDIPWIFISGYPLNLINKLNYVKDDIVLLQKPFEFQDLINLMVKTLINLRF